MNPATKADTAEESAGLYAVLGVSRSATPSEIKAAYRKLAQQHHPDREGGSLEEFQKIQHAYDVLSDPVRRERYDQSGDESESNSLEAEAINKLAELFNSLISDNIFRGNIVDTAKTKISESIANCESKIQAITRRISKLSKQLGRVVSKSGKDSIFQVVLESSIENLKNDQAEIEKINLLLNAMKAQLDDLTDTRPDVDPINAGPNIAEMFRGQMYNNIFKGFMP